MLDRAKYEGLIPEETLDTLMMYAVERTPTGGFLEAVLSNDLMAAVGRADAKNKHALGAICRFIYNELPSACHGSRRAVRDWLECTQGVTL